MHLKENISTIENYATGDAIQFMVSTDGHTINGKNRGLGGERARLEAISVISQSNRYHGTCQTVVSSIMRMSDRPREAIQYPFLMMR
jgi:hypothetical protein